MPSPPPPDVQTVRVRLDYDHDSGLKGGNRFYLSFTGTRPDGSTADTLATTIQTAWSAQFQPLFNPVWQLVEVDVLDITDDMGASGFWTGSDAGTNTGTPLPADACMNVEYDIARRYRGGKPRIYFPGATDGNQLNDTTWQSSFIADYAAAVPAFFSAIHSGAPGSMGDVNHISLSFYKGFTNETPTGKRYYATPTYRTPNAISDPITGYAPKAEISSQRRRRTSTTF